MADKQSNKDQERLTLYFQLSAGVFAALILAFGVWGYVGSSVHPVTVGMAIRVGATLAVVSLAMPQLAILRNRLPSIAIAFGLVAIFLIGTKPKIGNILLGILAVAFAANTALAWLASVTGKK